MSADAQANRALGIRLQEHQQQVRSERESWIEHAKSVKDRAISIQRSHLAIH